MNRLLVAAIAVMFLISCQGALWEGENSDTITISVDNPFYQGGSPSTASRALAMQGQYLYIELALITDQAAFDADFTKPMTGNGIWSDKPWGGHAIVALPLSIGTESIEATFQGEPKGVPLQVRALLDIDQFTLEEGLSLLYGSDGYPICHTYNSSGATYNEQQWITLSALELSSRTIQLPLRPSVIDLEFLPWTGSLNMYDDYTSTAMTMPFSVNNTRFFLIEPDIAALEVRDVAYYSLVYGTVPASDTPPASISYLYDNDGSAFEAGTPSYTSNLPAAANFTYKLLQTHVANLPDYTSPGYILGTSLISTPSSSWNLSFGLLYDNIDANDGGNSDFFVYGSIPSGFDQSDLDFRILNIASDFLAEDIDTIAEINLNSALFDSNWDTADITWSGLDFTFADLVYSPPVGSWILVIARTPDGEEFIFGRTTFLSLMV
ncbi:MAG: hypothetical protein JEY91_01870 [Spirochaetaceae bacterium]|nr:hypothetical protein [Spirochaetaceae bacterium]